MGGGLSCTVKTPAFAESSLWQPAWFNTLSSLAYCVTGLLLIRRSNLKSPVLPVLILVLGLYSTAFHFFLCTWLGQQDVLFMLAVLWRLGISRRSVLASALQTAIWTWTLLDYLHFQSAEVYIYAIALLPIPAAVLYSPGRRRLYLSVLLAGGGWMASELGYKSMPWVAWFQLLAVWHVATARALYVLLKPSTTRTSVHSSHLMP